MLSYKGTEFRSIIKGHMAQGGDLNISPRAPEPEELLGGGNLIDISNESIFDGSLFNDEGNFRLSHARPYLLAMDNNGPNENGSRFLITFKAVPYLDGEHVVFGEVISGKETIDKMSNVGTKKGFDIESIVTIVDSGEVPM